MEQGAYQVETLPVNFQRPTIQMSSEEMRRLCSEMHIPMFTLKCEEIRNELGTKKINKPYLRHICLYDGVMFRATEEIKGRKHGTT